MQGRFNLSYSGAFEVSGSLVKQFAVAGLIAAGGLQTAIATDDACSTTAVYAYADVTVSDGKTYGVESFYRSKDRAASKFIRTDGDSLHVVEGPYTWVKAGDKVELASDFQADFQRDYALGHQFHALLLHFRDVMSDIQPASGIDFAGGKGSGLRGARDTGGFTYLIEGREPDQPAGLRFDVGDLKIDIIASDWREVDGTAIPFALLIDDGSRTFDYQYKTIEITDRAPTWFYDSVAAPDLDAVQLIRLHKKSLAAHCIGDAGMLASLAAPAPVIVSGGGMFETSPEEMENIFSNTFKRRSYSNYIDTQQPQIEVSAAGDIGWASVQVNAKGVTEATGQPFDEQWAWVMLARKIDGEWRMTGNASNSRQ